MAFYAWFLRHPAGALAAHDAYAFRAFGCRGSADPRPRAIGSSIVMTTRFWRDPSTLIVFIGISTFVFYRLRIVPEHLGGQAVVPIILPGVCLAIAFALAPAATRGASVTRRLAGSARPRAPDPFRAGSVESRSATSADSHARGVRRHRGQDRQDRVPVRVAGSPRRRVAECLDVHVIALPLVHLGQACARAQHAEARSAALRRVHPMGAPAVSDGIPRRRRHGPSRATSRSNRWAAALQVPAMSR